MADNEFTTASRSGSTSSPAGSGGNLDPERMVENAKNMGNQLVGAVRDSATSLLDEQKRNAADQISSVAGMMRDSVQSLDRQSAGVICEYAEEAAQQIDDFADRLRHGSWGELAEDVEGFARRWPGVFMVSAVAAGFMAGRFLVASGTRVRQTSPTMPATPHTGTTGTGLTGTGTSAMTTGSSIGTSASSQSGARYDYGAGTGVSGTTNSGISSTGSKENF